MLGGIGSTRFRFSNQYFGTRIFFKIAINLVLSGIGAHSKVHQEASRIGCEVRVPALYFGGGRFEPRLLGEYAALVRLCMIESFFFDALIG